MIIIKGHFHFQQWNDKIRKILYAHWIYFGTTLLWDRHQKRKISIFSHFHNTYVINRDFAWWSGTNLRLLSCLIFCFFFFLRSTLNEKREKWNLLWKRISYPNLSYVLWFLSCLLTYYVFLVSVSHVFFLARVEWNGFMNYLYAYA